MEKDFVIIREQPTISTKRRLNLIDMYFNESAAAAPYLQAVNESKYLYWDKARFIDPIPKLTPAESWQLAHTVRRFNSQPAPIRAKNGAHFGWVRQEKVDEAQRTVDMYAGGQFLTNTPAITTRSERQKYIARGILEEAIASSQLEGADTSRRYAKHMIADNIKPRNKSDWMILNNYRTLSKIEENFVERSLSKNLLLELHQELTRHTIPDADSGRFRKDSDNIVVWFNEKIAHVPPNQSFVEHELDRLIEYANDNGKFIHPLVKATVLHFWLGYLHPFTDGNGRLARSLFYWYMLKNGYWALAYFPISTVIKRAPAQYAYAYIYAEQDSYDFTYFFNYHTEKVLEAIKEFRDYTKRTDEENSAITKKLHSIKNLNDRQKQIIYYLISDDSHYATISSHAELNAISRQTADKDIKGLLNLGLTFSVKQGASVLYYASDKLKTMINKE